MVLLVVIGMERHPYIEDGWDTYYLPHQNRNIAAYFSTEVT